MLGGAPSRRSRSRGFSSPPKWMYVTCVVLLLFVVELVVMGKLLRGGELGEEGDGQPIGSGSSLVRGSVDADGQQRDAAVALGKEPAVAQQQQEPQHQPQQLKPDAQQAGPQAEAQAKDSNPAHQSYRAGAPQSKFWARWRLKNARAFEPEPADIASRPLLEFVMIVKNEAASIAHTINSVKNWVDRYTILDTGSTDGTPELIKEAFGGVPGEVHNGEFMDFSTTRNRVLELAGLRCVFTLMLSGDESLQNGEALRSFLEEHRSWDWVKKEKRHEAYNMQVKYGSDVYDSTRIARTDAMWYYVGVTHEYMTNALRDVATIRVTKGAVTPSIYHDLSNNDPVKKRQRWKLDLQLLLSEWEARPNVTRTAFYVGQTYECLRDHDNAYKWYKRRFDLGGWAEEAYEAKFRMGRVAGYLGKPWPDVQQLWLDAHAYLPARAEPLYAIAQHYFQKDKNYPLAFLFAQRASQIPFPVHLRLFIDKPVYDFKSHDLLGIVAYYVGEYEAGERAVRRALKLSPNDQRLLKNLGFYTKRLRPGVPK